ncbi:MAG: serine/threonine-protein kinase [Gemmataceae bacterium]|nr:serine/threonine-protein kinase [Gemmataceae bacterium]
MGVVYKARQESLDREVALKMIRTGAAASGEEVRRFRGEAEAAARLQHPNIVQVFEVGEHEGIFYLAMELVEGETLAQKIAQAPLPSRPAAAITLTLATAAHAAHERNVVHRDLKPANILLGHPPAAVGDRPESKQGPETVWSATDSRWPATVKITDFGLAKRLDLPPGETIRGAIIGSPSYMAPEQAQGRSDKVGPAADVYALGAVLYEMLTGRPPFKAETPLDTIMQAVAQDPVPPSQLQPKLPRDLETICLKCLRKDPAGRYATAWDLAEDLRRFTDGEPIRARAVSMAERLWRWCQRNPLVASLLAVLVLVLGGGFAMVFWQWRQADQERQRAQANLQMLRESTTRFLESVSRSLVSRQPSIVALQKEMLQTLLEFQLRLLPVWGEDPAFESELAQTYNNLGGVQQITDQPAEALHSFEQARDIQTKLARHSDDPKVHDRRAIYLFNLGNFHQRNDRAAQALECYRQACATHEKLPKEPAFQAALARTYNNMGNSLSSLKQRDAERDFHKKALAIRQRLSDENPKVAEFQDGLAKTLVNLAVISSERGDQAEALALYEQAIRVREKLVHQHPQDAEYRSGLATAYQNCAIVHGLRGEPERTRHFSDLARSHRQKLTAQYPDRADYHAALAQSWHDLGISLTQLKRPDEALNAHEQAVESQCLALEKAPRDIGYRQLLSEEYFALARLQRELGHRTDASRTLLKCRELWPENPNQLYEVARELALCVPLAGKDQAEQHKYADQAMEVLQQTVRGGFKDVERMKKDPNLNPLRSRADFKDLLAQLGKKP